MKNYGKWRIKRKGGKEKSITNGGMIKHKSIRVRTENVAKKEVQKTEDGERERMGK